MFTPHEKIVLLGLGRAELGLPPDRGGHALGRILLAAGEINQQQLDGALLAQTRSGRYLGEELITAGHASTAQVEGGLRLQRKLMVYALASALGFAPLVLSPALASQKSAAMRVSVTVVASARLRSSYQVAQLHVDAADIARGFVEIAAASRFTVSTNSRAGYLMEFFPVGNLFELVLIDGLGATVALGADGGDVARRGPPQPDLSHELNFRFMLRPGTRPGDYPWPLQLSVRPL